jgi:hypothetical protein
MKRRKATVDLASAIDRIESFVTGDGCLCPATDDQRRYFAAWVQPVLIRVLVELEEGA